MSARERVGRAREGEGLSSVLETLRRRWLIVAGVVLAAVAVMVFSHERKPKSYSASSSVVFQSGTLSDSALQVTPSSSGEPQREADTEVLIAHSPEVAQAVAKQLKVPGSGSELLGLVAVEAAPNADILNIVAKTGDPEYSPRLANAFAEQYIAFQAQSQLAGISTAQNKLQQQIDGLPAGSSERLALQQSLQRLASLRAVAGGGASIIGRAVSPGSVTGTSLSTSVAIGMVVGLAIAFSLVFLLETLDRRIKSIEEFERGYGLPTLAAIPQSAFRAHGADQRTELLEPYRILRSALDFAAVTRRLDTLLVTSAIAGEGKTTVAIDLAHAVALTGRRTVLIELDLRRPTFAEHFNLSRERGLTTALVGNSPVGDLLVEPLADVPNLVVLPSGPLPHNPSELLGSDRITEIISQLVAGGGMVIIDAPPLNPVADAQVLLNKQIINAAIIVGRINRTKRDDVRRARAILDRHIVELAGIVVTGINDAGRYSYGTYQGDLPTVEVDVEDVSGFASHSEPRRLPV